MSKIGEPDILTDIEVVRYSSDGGLLGRDYLYSWKPEGYDEYYLWHTETGELRFPTLAEMGIQLEQPDYSGVWGNFNYFLTGGKVGGSKYNLKGEYVGQAPITGAPDWIGGFRNPGKILNSAKEAVNAGQKVFQSSNAAFRAAKRANNIPVGFQPIKSFTVADKVNPQLQLRVFQFRNNSGKLIEIRKDLPRMFPDGGFQGQHFNAGLAGEKLPQHFFFK